MSRIWLDHEDISFGGRIEYLSCEECRYKTFRLKLYAETDMNYVGVIGLTDINNKRLLITRYDWEQLIPVLGNKFHGFHEYFENKINNLFNSNEYKFIAWKEVAREDYGTETKYICPQCNSYLNSLKSTNFEEFINQGGEIITLNIHNQTNGGNPI